MRSEATYDGDALVVTLRIPLEQARTQGVEPVVGSAARAVRAHLRAVTRRVAVAGCPTCDREVAAGNRHFPPHDASTRCESGGHTHCACDTCF